MDYALALVNFLDSNGKLMSYPAKRKMQILARFYLASKLEAGKKYSENEINEELKSLHTFSDHCLLRRELCDGKFLDRERNGSHYWLTEIQPDPAKYGIN